MAYVPDALWDGVVLLRVIVSKETVYVTVLIVMIVVMERAKYMKLIN